MENAQFISDIIGMDSRMLSVLELALIKNDTDTLMGLQKINQNGVLQLAALPHYALFCQGVLEYVRKLDFQLEYHQEAITKFADVRSSLKLFSEGYKSWENRILRVDEIQDDEFRKRLRYPILGKLKWHYNLGIYLDEHGNIICNTQYAMFMFYGSRMPTGSVDGKMAFDLGKYAGEVLGAVHESLKSMFDELRIPLNKLDIPLYYKDYNTDRKFSLFPSLPNGKELTLRLLHILSSINIIRYVIRAEVPASNPWQLRVKYIRMYYAIKSIEKIVTSVFKHQVCPPQLQLSYDKQLLNAEFRSCMMHYGLSNKGESAIKEEHFNYDSPLFGLVESCFDFDYYTLNDAVDKVLDDISDNLASLLCFNFKGVKRL